MKTSFLPLLLIGLINTVSAQQPFFKSANEVKKESSTFYSSIRIQGDLLIFNATDYHLYVYDKNSHALKWTNYLNWKSNQAPFRVRNELWCNVSENDMIRLDAATGTLLKPLVFSSVLSQPIIKNDMAYFTGIYDGGSVFGYDLNADSIKWSKFIAHGCSETPYYTADKIIANAESDYWLELNYDGTLVNKKCQDLTYRFPSELPCVRQFRVLTHDNREFKGKFAEQLLDYNYGAATDIARSNRLTCILSNDQLTIIGDKLKVKKEISIGSLNDTLEVNEYAYRKIISVSDKQISFIHSNHLFQWDLSENKLLSDRDLSAYEPHQAILDDKKLWIISKKDERLYGFTF